MMFMGLTALFVQGQFIPYKYPGDTLGIYTNITFEEPTPYITILPLPQNLWQIGAPHKVFFDSAYTPPNAIITDTISNYPKNNLSTFELIAGQFNALYYPFEIFIDFRHKYDSDTLSDGGFITVSWDNGLSWMNIINDTTHYFEITPKTNWGIVGNTNLYNSESLLNNGEPGFSGHSGSWIHTSMAWYNLPVYKHPEWGGPDTMRLRFNFTSDNVEQNREGWMIDQIRLFAIDLGSGIQEYLAGKTHSWFYPNPVTSSATFTLNRTYRNVHYEITDSKGILVSKSDRGNCDEFIFERGILPPGIYFMRLLLDKQITDIHRIIIAP
jgi:hypothetical protein